MKERTGRTFFFFPSGLKYETKDLSNVGLQNYLKGFVSSLEGYEIVSEQDWQLYGQNASSVRDPAKRRELKIKQYQKEKEIRGRIEVRIPLPSPLLPKFQSSLLLRSLTTRRILGGVHVPQDTPQTSSPKLDR